MAGVPIKFRCYQCNLLLGISRSKVGSIVNCPKCSAQLIVPEPDETPAAASQAAAENTHASEAETTPAFLSALAEGLPAEIAEIRPEDIRIDTGIDLSSYPKPGPAATATEEPEPAPFPAPPEPLPEMVHPWPSRKTPDPETAYIPQPTATPTPTMPPTPPGPVVPPIKVEAPTLVAERATVRARDLVLPRSVVAFWSLFVLLAQVLAFFAGLLAGHFIWRVH